MRATAGAHGPSADDPTAPGATRRDWFLVRWFASVAVTLAVAGLVEYGIGAQLLADRLLEDSAQHHLVHAPHMEEVLAADLTPAERTAAVQAELQDIVDTGYGTTYAALFDADGQRLAAAVPEGTTVTEDAVDPALLREALAHGAAGRRRRAGGRRDAGCPGATSSCCRSSGPGGGAVLEVDQRDSVIGRLVTDLRWNLVLGVLVALVVSVPMSYLFGGRRLHRDQRVAERAANVDALTGLTGRRPFRPGRGGRAVASAGAPVTLALVDLDEFKQVNDRLGHSYGDQVLVALAGALEAVRAGDTAYRLGGDEFAVLLPAADEPTGVAVLERVREALTEALPGIGFSCGVATADPGDGTAVQALWERADAALYEAKRTGRGRTATFSATASPLTISPAKVQAVHGLLASSSPLDGGVPARLGPAPRRAAGPRGAAPAARRRPARRAAGGLRPGPAARPGRRPRRPRPRDRRPLAPAHRLARSAVRQRAPRRAHHHGPARVRRRAGRGRARAGRRGARGHRAGRTSTTPSRSAPCAPPGRSASGSPWTTWAAATPACGR